MAAFGATPEQVETWIEPQEDIYEVWPENWPAVRLFCALTTQWRYAGAAGLRAGLDYAVIEPTARLIEIETTPELFATLRFMESQAMEELSRKRK